MVPNVARLPSQTTDTNESDDDSIDDPSLEKRHGKNADVHQGAKSDVDKDPANRKLRAANRTWDESYSSLVSHLKEHREWPNTRTNLKLAQWVSQQRRNKMKNRVCFTERRVAKLSRLGISWEPGVPHKYVCPVEFDIQYLRAWMPRLTVLQFFLEKHQRWPSRETNLDLYEWVLKQQLLLVHDDTPDSMERMQMEELEKVGIDWENDMADEMFLPSTAYQALNV